MKKLILKGSITEMLTRAQMKQVIGGDSCTAACADGGSVTCSGMNCEIVDYSDTSDGWCSSDAGIVNC